MEKTLSKQRESGFELLRILCITGIIFMHTFGPLNDSLGVLNREVSIFINAVANTGVTCFILISGWFGIRFDLEKLIRLDLVIIFYTLAGTLLSGDIGIKSLILSCIPILSRRYWFLSCYFALCLLSVFLNQLAEKAGKKLLGGILLLMLFLFSFLPTFFYYELIPDGGKGLVQMVMVYLIGRYLRLTLTKPLRRGRILILYLLSTAVIFAANSALSFVKGTQMGMFARDNSLFIIASSVLLLLLFRELHFHCPVVNHLAGNVMPLYVFESFVRICILNRFISLSAHTGSPLLIVYVTGYVLLTVAICMAVNELRRLSFAHLDNLIASFLMKLYRAAVPAVTKLWQNSCTKLCHYLEGDHT